MQIRLAQRAYRSRQQASFTSLNHRIGQLETILNKMSSTVLSFSGQLVQSGALEGYPGITARLRDTMKTFVSLASEANSDGETNVSHASPPSEHSSVQPTEDQEKNPSRSLFVGPMTGQSSSVLSSSTLEYNGSHLIPSSIVPHTFESPKISVVTLPEFIKRLHLECLNQGYLALCDPFTSLDNLRRPFGLCLTMMNRERLISYFRAELDAQINCMPLDEWDFIPFFSLGGAGTHYPQSSSQFQGAGYPLRRYSESNTVKDPLPWFPPDIQGELEGDWFDMQDLEGFLREKDVHLLCPGEPKKQDPPTQTSINIVHLIPGKPGVPFSN